MTIGKKTQISIKKPTKIEAKVRVYYPVDPFIRSNIDRVSRLVSKYGSAIEREIFEMEKDNPDFRFLREKGSQEHNYYRWRTLSYFLEGEKGPYSRTPFCFDEDESQLWYPPEYYDLPELDQENEQRGVKYIKRQYMANEKLEASKLVKLHNLLRDLKPEVRLVRDLQNLLTRHSVEFNSSRP